MPPSPLELAAATPEPVRENCFNSRCVLPYGLTTDHIRQAMSGFVDLLGFMNMQMLERDFKRMESFLMPANFSSMVGEFMHVGIDKYCEGLVKNKYHNGHPDLIPANHFPGDSVQHATEGIEIKGSRYPKGWQGHNAEECWLMVFVFDGSRPSDDDKGVKPKPFRFNAVYGAQLTAEDWKFSGRSEKSRRTITASVIDSGYQKMRGNWIYDRNMGETLNNIGD